MSKITFLIVESSYLLRRGLSFAIEEIRGAQVVNETDDAAKIIKLIKKHKPNYCLINQKFLHNKLIISSLQKFKKSTQFIGICLEQQTSLYGFLFSEFIYVNSDRNTILQSIKKLVDKIPNRKQERSKSSELTKREKTVLKEIALGLTNKEIAEKLFISTHTVVTHRKNITKKLGINTVSGLTVYAVIHKLIQLNYT